MKLKKIDLKKSDKHTHPDIKLNKWYLAKVSGNYSAGMLTKQWYGLNFDGFYSAGLQFDAPGTNASRWQALWEIVDKKIK